MAINIFLKFPSFVSPAQNNSSQLKFYFMYAQGVPLLLCSLVFIIDHCGPCSWILPNMGKAQCFLGAPWESQWSTTDSAINAIFLNSEFIYFHSILLVLQSSNVVFFLLTLKHLISHWWITGSVLQVESRGNFLIVVKLFFIMGKFSKLISFSIN